MRLGIGEAMLENYVAGHRALPDPLLLQTVDIILAERSSGALPARPRPDASPVAHSPEGAADGS